MEVNRGKQNFNANCLRRRTPAQTNSPIYKPKFSSKNPAKKLSYLISLLFKGLMYKGSIYFIIN